MLAVIHACVFTFGCCIIYSLSLSLQVVEQSKELPVKSAKMQNHSSYRMEQKKVITEKKKNLKLMNLA